MQVGGAKLSESLARTKYTRITAVVSLQQILGMAEGLGELHQTGWWT